MQADKVLDFKANYKIIKAPLEILPSIYCELKKISIAENYQKIKKLIEKGDENIIIFLTQELKNYKGNFKDLLVISEDHNLIPLVFRNELAKRIIWTFDKTLEANYIWIWTDSTAATENDTQLWTEVLRGLFTRRTRTDNVAYLDKFFGSTEVAGLNLKEIWVFTDATATANSWILMSKININESMGANETLTINISLTISSAT